MFKVLGVSLGITLFISIGVGFVLKDFIGFWQGVVGAFITQFIAFYFISITKTNNGAEEAQDIGSGIVELQTVPITCPCGKNTFTSPIFFNVDNSFLCEKCGSRFKVELNYDTVLLTEPMNIENIFNQLKEKELSDNKV